MTILHRAMTIGLGVALLGSISPGFSGAAQAQQQWTTQQGVNGYNVTQANFSDGVFRQTGNGRWTEFNASGRATYSFTETGRDEWSVYLDDPSRNVQLQIDIHRKWVTYGTNGGPKSDLYRIVSAVRNATPPPTSAVTDGRNVQQVFFDRGSFKKTGPRQWTEYDAQGRAAFNFTETGRDQWSVYLDDQSRNVQLQLDLYRKWVGYGQNGSGKSDLYRITASSPRQIAYPPPRRAPRPVSNTRNVNGGPIWNQQDAQRKCPAVAASQGGEWTGQWRTTVQGKMSVCEIRF